MSGFLFNSCPYRCFYVRCVWGCRTWLRMSLACYLYEPRFVWCAAKCTTGSSLMMLHPLGVFLQRWLPVSITMGEVMKSFAHSGWEGKRLCQCRSPCRQGRDALSSAPLQCQGGLLGMGDGGSVFPSAAPLCHSQTCAWAPNLSKSPVIFLRW